MSRVWKHVRALAFVLVTLLVGCEIRDDSSPASGVSIDVQTLRSNGWRVYGKDDEAAAMREAQSLQGELAGKHGTGDLIFAVRRSQGRTEIILLAVVQ